MCPPKEDKKGVDVFHAQYPWLHYILFCFMHSIWEIHNEEGMQSASSVNAMQTTFIRENEQLLVCVKMRRAHPSTTGPVHLCHISIQQNFEHNRISNRCLIFRQGTIYVVSKIHQNRTIFFFIIFQN